mmetsp:Transcript_23999/g.39763  ORF Transcript_23999/g.39763 Transcript_23999/m.39763 type:complete len:114 (+) Transcript_23999:2-343(+)
MTAAEKRKVKKFSPFQVVQMFTLYGTKQGELMFTGLDFMKARRSGRPVFHPVDVPNKWEARRHLAKRWQGHSNQQKEAARRTNEEHEEDGELLSEDELEFGVEEEDEEEEGES